MKLYKFLYKQKNYQLVLLGILISVISVSVIVVFFDWLNLIESIDDDELRLSIPKIIAIITIGPFLETVFFQYFPVKLGHYIFKKFKYSYFVSITFSSLLFASLHPHELFYFISMLILGLILSFFCFIFIRKTKFDLLFTSLIHSGYNFIILIIRMFELDFNILK